MRLLSRLRTLLLFTPEELGLLLESWTLILVWWVRVKALRQQPLAEHLEEPIFGEGVVGAGDSEARLVRVFRIAHRTHPLIDTTCLVRSLALRDLLGRRGIASSVRLGARVSDAAAFEAHAWLEREGRVLFDPEEFVKTYSVIR